MWKFKKLRSILYTFVVITLCIALAPSFSEGGNKGEARDWYWFMARTSPTGTWAITQGRAIVRIRNGSIEAVLYDSVDARGPWHTVSGTIKDGKIKSIVHTHESDVDPEDFAGTYDKSPKWHRHYPGTETIILSNVIATIGITRATPTAAVAP